MTKMYMVIRDMVIKAPTLNDIEHHIFDASIVMSIQAGDI